MKGSNVLKFVVCLLLIFAFCKGDHIDKNKVPQNPQFTELKTLIDQMNTKLYIFDNHLSIIKQSILNVEARMTLVESQAEDIKELLHHNHGSGHPCTEVADTNRRTTSAPHSRVGGQQSDCCSDLSKKLDDFGYKISKSQQELAEENVKHHETLGSLIDTIRNGFTKTFQKTDLLTKIDRQTVGIPRMSGTVERLYNMTHRMAVTQNDIKIIAQGASNQPSQGSNVNTERIATSLSHAMGLGEDVKSGIAKFLEVESEIVGAKKLAKNLYSGRDTRRPVIEETLKTLLSTIENIESTLEPLYFSIPNSFSGMFEYLNITLNSLDFKEKCNFQDVFRHEMNKIAEELQKTSENTCNSNDVHGSIDGSGQPGNNIVNSHRNKKQQEILDNVVYARAAMLDVKSDLERVFQHCPDGSVSTAKPLGLVIG